MNENGAAAKSSIAACELSDSALVSPVECSQDKNLFFISVQGKPFHKSARVLAKSIYVIVKSILIICHASAMFFFFLDIYPALPQDLYSSCDSYNSQLFATSLYRG